MDMKKIFFALAFISVLSIASAELFYFRFHTYFIENEVQEAFPAPTTTRGGLEGDSIKADAPSVVATGQFTKVDAIHKGSGVAKLIKQGEKLFLSLEDFQVTNGPDLHVYLSDAVTPGKDLASLGNFEDLGLLKGNVGNQYYEVPDVTSAYRTVVIWCQSFGVLFSFAGMR